MEITAIVLTTFLASILTFFSGFGFGTILLPVFAIFFPVDIAIALTGLVHFAINLFKITLVGKNADRQVLMRFGLPAILASFAGAWLLLRITQMPALFEYRFVGRTLEVTPVKLVVALLLLVFSLLEVIPSVQRMQFGREKLPIGGLLSGFFGGLTGIQGAVRSAFLIRSGLSKEAYIATGVVIASLVDFTRLSVYATRFREAALHEHVALILAAVAAAMAGAVLGNRLLKRITLRFIRIIVAVMLFLVAIALGMGLI
jgi:uncharacterized membrane protein YfcA